MRRYLSGALVALVTALTLAAPSCSLSPDVQSEEVRPLVNSVVEYHDAAAARFLQDDTAVESALAESRALVAALAADQVARDRFRALVSPVVTRYSQFVATDPELGDTEREMRALDIQILERVAGGL